jgi:hypothetical protein
MKSKQLENRRLSVREPCTKQGEEPGRSWFVRSFQTIFSGLDQHRRKGSAGAGSGPGASGPGRPGRGTSASGGRRKLCGAVSRYGDCVPGQPRYA